MNTPPSARGRPTKPFNQLNSASQRQRTRSIRQEYSTEELSFATAMSFKASGNLNAAKIVEVLRQSPDNSSQIIKSLKQSKIEEYTKEEALALYIDTALSSRKYKLLQQGAKRKNSPLYPSYHQVNVAKKECYPPEEQCKITETGFAITLQAILDITISRLLKSLNLSFDGNNKKLCLICKWGFDGASSQSQYKQKFTDPEADDKCLFMTSLVPIVLMSDGDILWQNNKPSSTTLCRPIRLEFHKETTDYSLQIYNDIEEEIRKLNPTITNYNCEGSTIEVSHKLVCTMIDGKVCHVITHTKSSHTCEICGATPTQMNDLISVEEKHKHSEFYQYGLSTLHCWIRFLECVLHISYKLSFKKWSARDLVDKEKVQKRKEEIQKEFRDKMGLKIDFVKQGGGNTNDGNTARRFFRDYKVSAQITGFDESVLKRFAVILQALSSGEQIHVKNFQTYTRETAQLYVQIYGWYYMPVTVHKILIHGHEIIEHALVPIGQLSEEVQESRHKEVRRYRLNNTRKTSREETVQDLMHSLLYSSDPLIYNHRQPTISKKFDLFDDTKKLLKEQAVDKDETE